MTKNKEIIYHFDDKKRVDRNQLQYIINARIKASKPLAQNIIK